MKFENVLLLLNLLGVLYGVNGQFMRSSTVMTYYDALIYCEREHNTGLISIKDNNANADVLKSCGNNATCWIGNSYNNWINNTPVCLYILIYYV